MQPGAQLSARNVKRAIPYSSMQTVITPSGFVFVKSAIMWPSKLAAELPSETHKTDHLIQLHVQGQSSNILVPQSHERRPRWWHGNLLKAFYWACVGQPDKLDRKATQAKQQLTDIQARAFSNTGEPLISATTTPACGTFCM